MGTLTDWSHPGLPDFFSEKNHFGLKKEPMEPFIVLKKATIKPHFKAIKRDVWCFDSICFPYLNKVRTVSWTCSSYMKQKSGLFEIKNSKKIIWSK